MATQPSSSWKTNQECFVFWRRSFQGTVIRSWWRPTANRQSKSIAVTSCRIDVVLLDVGLPKIAGWQVFLKMKEENPAVRVVIASGYLDPKMKADMSCAGVKHFVDKPYLLDALVETIGDVIERK